MKGLAVSILRLRVFGFLHAGRERQRQLFKRTWPLLPGSTVYGALCASMILSRCVRRAGDGDITGIAKHCLQCGKCPFPGWLQHIRPKEDPLMEGTLRFSPFLPVEEGLKLANALDFNDLARKLGEEWGLWTGEPQRARNLWMSPHLSRLRDTGAAAPGSLHALEHHAAGQVYRGFVLHPDDEDFRKSLDAAILTLPLVPFGGRGKFCQAEGTVESTMPAEGFMAALRERFQSTVMPEAAWLLTPYPLEEGTKPAAQLDRDFESYPPRFRRYQVWREGPYPARLSGKRVFQDEKGESRAVLVLAEGTRMKVKGKDESRLADNFLRGVGNVDWTYLGWGQVIYQ